MEIPPTDSKLLKRPPVGGVTRNPGCDQCVYYLSPGIAGAGGGACRFNARRVSKKTEGVKIYKWIDCDKPDIKNHRGYCPDFKFKNALLAFLGGLLKTLLKPISGEKQFEKCAFVDEKWWLPS